MFQQNQHTLNVGQKVFYILPYTFICLCIRIEMYTISWQEKEKNVYFSDDLLKPIRDNQLELSHIIMISVH